VPILIRFNAILSKLQPGCRTEEKYEHYWFDNLTFNIHYTWANLFSLLSGTTT